MSTEITKVYVHVNFALSQDDRIIGKCLSPPLDDLVVVGFGQSMVRASLREAIATRLGHQDFELLEKE